MNSLKSLEAAIDPGNRLTFLLDWELTMKCNLDCSYCPTGIYGGHNNSTPHPKLEECLASLDFMFEYVDIYMANRIQSLKYVVLNVYGGESLYHPDIVEILQQSRNKHKKYQDRWQLTITTTTNAIVSDKQLAKIIPLVDEFTISYHSEATPKQKQQFKQNALTIVNAGKNLKCVVLMHADQQLFADSEQMIAWLKENNIRCLPRQLDHPNARTDLNYTTHQVTWFENLYKAKSYTQKESEMPTLVLDDQGHVDLADTGRACCGGRQVCENSNHKDRKFYVANKFPGWYCSVNHFFLYVKQVTKEIFVNKDCKMNFDGTVSPIGLLDHAQDLIIRTRQQIDSNSLPVIQCAKNRCYCGLCSPKAKDLDTYNSIMKKYQKTAS